jgi:NAD(P) transhydrogenase subunit beta
MMQNFHLVYLFCAICFILALKGLSSPKEARMGNYFGIIGMSIAVLSCFYHPLVINSLLKNYAFIITPIALGAGIGAVIAYRLKMQQMPELIAGFHSLVGLSAGLVAYSAFYDPETFGIGLRGALPTAALLEMALGLIIAMITFSGSVLAFLKLAALIHGKPITFPGQKYLLLAMSLFLIWSVTSFVQQQSGLFFNLICVSSIVIGALLILPVGAADMPVIVSMLNSYSGWATCGIGFTLQNSLLVIVGALVGASGAILSYVMCKAMNSSILQVIFSAFVSANNQAVMQTGDVRAVNKSSPQDAAYILENSQSVIIVPGYGMAVAGAQSSIKELTELLQQKGKSVKFAIHPVAGRMPGHMNVLLAEGNIDYDQVFELEDINSQFGNTDVVLVIGANDVTNPAAKNNPQSSIYGMPILNVENARTVFFIKRSMAAGYAGIENELFFRPNTMMLFGDAKKVAEQIIRSLKD